jgi:pimeloyl-ACP methyl ester carboxylesterase
MSQATHAKNIVLVHGAFADGSSWSKVIPLLQAKGYKVTSYGGVVITETGNDSKVVGLVYVAAFAPDAGQSIVEISKNFPKPIGLEKLVPQPDGFLLLSADGVETGFAQDLSKEEQNILTAVQPETAGSLFAAEPTEAAWHTKPSWYIVASNDHMIDPGQEASMAKEIKATTTTLPSSHVVMLSHPNEVAKVIEEAATSAK